MFIYINEHMFTKHDCKNFKLLTRNKLFWHVTLQWDKNVFMHLGNKLIYLDFCTSYITIITIPNFNIYYGHIWSNLIISTLLHRNFYYIASVYNYVNCLETTFNRTKLYYSHDKDKDDE